MIEREHLFKPRIPEEEYEIEGIGTIRIRGLSRVETLRAKKSAGNVDEFEVKVLSIGVVEPHLSEDDVRAWQASAISQEVEDVANTILELSGLLPSTKEATERRMMLDGEARFRVPAGPDAGDDGGGTPGEDE